MHIRTYVYVHNQRLLYVCTLLNITLDDGGYSPPGEGKVQ